MNDQLLINIAMILIFAGFLTIFLAVVLIFFMNIRGKEKLGEEEQS